MAVYKIFPDKDATIFSEFKTKNSGLSEILDLSKNISLNYPSYSAVGRILIKFDNADINLVISNYVGSSSYSASLRMFLADASAIPLEWSLESYAISGSWDVGTGRADNVPITTNGVSWQNNKANPISLWPSGGYAIGVTGSYFSNNPGGGTWYTGSLITQSFDNDAPLDLNFDVSSVIRQYVSGSLMNDGFIIKNASAIEFDKNYQYKLTYFSKDTNTIYPPQLEIKWDDSVYIPNTSSMALIGITPVVSLGDNKGVYSPYSIVRFNVNARDQYPRKTFVTSSLYTVNQYLPSSSYYRVTDLDTDNVVIDFDKQFTKISTDQNGSFFNLYMNGLEPERYYKFQIMTVLNGITTVYDNNFYFKVSKN